MRPRLLSAGAAVAAALLLTGSSAVSGSAAEDDGAIAAGSAAASSFFITYFDEKTIFEGGTLAPLDVNYGFSTGDIDRGGSSSALAALAYSPYVDLPPAVNALAPGPDVDFEPILSRVRASVTGQPPKDGVASLVTPTQQAEVGTVEAHLAEGPVAEAFSTLGRVEPSPGTSIRSTVSRIKVAKVSGRAVTEATTVLRSVNIAGLLTFETIALRSTTVADGGAGDAQADVVVEGAAIAGFPIRLTQEGFQVLDRVVPVDLARLGSRLTEAGIDLVGPGVRETQPGGESSVAKATGPRIRITSRGGRVIEMVFGHAEAASTLLPGFALPPLLPEIPSIVDAPFVPSAPVDLGGSLLPPPPDAGIVQPPATTGSAIVDLGPLVLSDARSVDGFAALYGALAVGGMLVLAGVVLPRRRSFLEDRLR